MNLKLGGAVEHATHHWRSLERDYYQPDALNWNSIQPVRISLQ